MMRVLNRFGITPAGTCGHSYGELAALFASGRFDERTFFELSVARGKFMAQAGGSGDKGGMLAVKAPMDAIEELIRNSGLDIVLANRNSPDQGVLSGPTDDISAMKNLCRDKKIRATLLPVAAAFHSRLVQAAAEPFAQKIASVPFFGPGLPVYSNTTGAPYPDSPDAAKKIFSSHLMNPVRFIEEIETMHADGVLIFVEVGPRAVLTGLIKAILKDQPAYALAVDASSGRHSGIADLGRTLCMLSALGYPVNLTEWKKPDHR
jgi:acyl transferase domain-containing protein